MSKISDDLEQFYKDWIGGRRMELMRRLADNVQYLEGQSGEGNASGRTSVLATLTRWTASFTDPSIKGLHIELAPTYVSDVRGARYCCTVRYRFSGRYVRTLPGLERIAPANRTTAHLAVTDTVWLDANGKVIQIINRFPILHLN